MAYPGGIRLQKYLRGGATPATTVAAMAEIAAAMETALTGTAAAVVLVGTEVDVAIGEAGPVTAAAVVAATNGAQVRRTAEKEEDATALRG